MIKRNNNHAMLPLIANMLATESSNQPLMPRICDECYDVLLNAINNAVDNNIAAVHCPHYMVLVEVELADGVPLGVTTTGPITQDEANAKIDESY